MLTRRTHVDTPTGRILDRPESDQIRSPLSPETTFRLEYWVAQLLADADPQFLKSAIEKHQLGHPLAQELEFFGQVRSEDIAKVKDYLELFGPRFRAFVLRVSWISCRFVSFVVQVP